MPVVQYAFQISDSLNFPCANCVLSHFRREWRGGDLVNPLVNLQKMKILIWWFYSVGRCWFGDFTERGHP